MARSPFCRDLCGRGKRIELMSITELQETQNNKRDHQRSAETSWPWRAAHGGHGGMAAVTTDAEGDCGGERWLQRFEEDRKN